MDGLGERDYVEEAGDVELRTMMVSVWLYGGKDGCLGAGTGSSRMRLVGPGRWFVVPVSYLAIMVVLCSIEKCCASPNLLQGGFDSTRVDKGLRT